MQPNARDFEMELEAMDDDTAQDIPVQDSESIQLVTSLH